MRSAARLVGEAALLSGLWAAQRDDYPITVKTGHSIAELVLSPREIDYTGIARPDAMILLSRDGVAKVGPQLAAMTPEDQVFAVPDVADVKTTRDRARHRSRDGSRAGWARAASRSTASPAP